MAFTVINKENSMGARCDHHAANEQMTRILGYGGHMVSIGENCRFTIIKNKPMDMEREATIDKIINVLKNHIPKDQ